MNNLAKYLGQRSFVGIRTHTHTHDRLLYLVH